MTPTANSTLTSLPHIPSSTGSELGIIPDMNSPVTRTLEEETSPQTSCKSRDQSHDSPDPCSRESEEVREMLSECLLEDDEFGEDWVLESRPLSFSED